MGNILHGNAKTTARVRAEIQASQESIAKLAERYHLNPKTVHKWKNRTGVSDEKSGAKKVRSVLSELEQQVICEFRRVSQFSLDDCFIVLKEQIPNLSRSNLHRCLKRNGLSVLPKIESGKKEKQKFREYEIGYVHIDITQIKLSDKQSYYLFVAIDRVSKYVYCEIYERQTIKQSCLFLENLINDYPCLIHTILTDNGAQFTYQLLAEHLRPRNKIHAFDLICKKYSIKHKLTQFRHPWTNGQVEVMNKIIKEHTTKKYHYDSIESLKAHLMSFILYYNHQKKLKTLKYKTPYTFLVEKYEKTPLLFRYNPIHKSVGLNT